MSDMQNKNRLEDYTNDVICSNRVYRCLECNFVGKERESDEHQCETDHCMELVK